MKNSFYLIIIFVFTVNLIFFYKNYSAGNFLIENVSGDAAHFLEIAKNLNLFGVYGDGNSSIPTESATWRAPFFPLILSLFLIFSDNILSLVLFKVLFQVLLIIIGCYYLHKNKIFSNSVFVCVPFIFVEPYFLKYSYSLLSESVSASLLFLFICFFLISFINGKYYITTVFLSFLCIINHPIVVFFIFIVLSILFIKLLFRDKILAFKLSLLFISLILIWPVRNYLVFDKGLFLTASQGATFSKGWNEKVAIEFNNIDGDLADEGINLKYLKVDLYNNLSSLSILELSNLYSLATKEFIKNNGFKNNFLIAKKKVISNFMPFPEKHKPGIIENIAGLFRVLYLIFFLFSIYYLLFIRSGNVLVYIIYLSIYLSQILMAVYIYTGLRFNSVYNLVLLFILIFYINNLRLFVKNKCSL